MQSKEQTFEKAYLTALGKDSESLIFNFLKQTLF